MVAQLLSTALMSVLTFSGLKINEAVKHRYEVDSQKIELMQQYCPPVTQLGVDPSDKLLEIRERDCQALRSYLQEINKPKIRRGFLRR